MNKELIKNELQWLIEAINEQYEAIHGHIDKIPHIEFDILMENVRKFYENMLLLQRLNDPRFSYEKISKPLEIKKEIHVEIPKVQMVKEPLHPEQAPRLPVKEPLPPEPEPAVGQANPEVAVRYGQPAHFKPAGPAQHEPASIPKKPAKSLEIDLFAAEEPTFSIKLKDAREKIFSPKVPSERIQNLKSAISINEKFMFINELFDGNLREYNETIETLNGFKNLDQAADFLDLMRKKNFWDTGSNAFRKLKELVERRF
jgi:hypothetical protein